VTAACDDPGLPPSRRLGRPLFSVRVADDDGRTVLWASGELDFTGAALMDSALSGFPARPGQGLTVDVSRLGFLDVSGLRLLVTANERLRGVSGPGLTVRGASGIVRRIFEVMQVTALLDDREPPAAGVPATVPQQAGTLDLARQAAGLSVTDLYVGYFALGGTAEIGDLAAYLAGNPDALDGHQRALAAAAVNERLIDLGRADRLISFDLSEKDRGLEWT
jgi:anti-sigma B factor antagonist